MRQLFARVAVAVAALVFVIGFPAVMAAIGATPIPTGIPSGGEVWDFLTSPDGGTAFLVFLQVIGWVAWAAFTIPLLLEIGAVLRHRSTPDLRGLSVPQGAARWIVTTVLVGGITASTGVAAHAAATPAAPVDHGTTTAQAPAGHPDRADSTDAPAAPEQAAGERGADQPTIEVLTKDGDTLWGLAQTYLGDGARWKEIANLNYGRPQPDGRSLGTDHWIYPGWTLLVPKIATGDQAHTITAVEGQTLSAIALDAYGDASLSDAIFEASRNTRQPDGQFLTDPDLIYPGWTITIPANPNTTSGAQPGTADTPTPPAKAPVSPPANPRTAGGSGNGGDNAGDPGTHAPADDEVKDHDAQTAPPTTSDDGQTGKDGSTTDAAADAGGVDQIIDDLESAPVRTIGGVGAILAAGVVGLLAARRRQQRRRTKPGQSAPVPAGETLEVSQQLHAVEDPISVATVDLGLRALARECAATGRALPVVRAGRLTAEQFELYLDQPADLPAPWAATSEPTMWVLPADREGTIDPGELAGITAPYPSLVTIGQDHEDCHILLDLEYAGSLAVNGNPEQTRAALAAVAIELSQSRWADDLQVTVVGGFPELEDVVKSGRIRYLPAIGNVLDDLARRGIGDRTALAEAGVPDLNHARPSGQVPGAWDPEIVLLAAPITPEQATRLADLTSAMPRVAIATITTGDPVGEWQLDVHDTNTAVLQPLGLDLQPALVDDATYAHILELLAITDDEPTGHPAAEPTVEELAQVTPALDEPAYLVDDAGEYTVVNGVPQTEEAEDLGDQPDTEVATSPAVDAAAHAAVEPAADAAGDEVTPTASTVDGDDDDDHGAMGPTVEAGSGPAAPAQSAAAPLEAPEPHAGSERPADGDQGAPVAADEQAIPSEAPAALNPPVISVLGYVDIEGATGPVEPNKRAQLVELAAFLAFHRDATLEEVNEALWPIDEGLPPAERARKDASRTNTRGTAVNKLRKWLGGDYVPRHDPYNLSPEIRTTWDLFRDLVGDDPAKVGSAATDDLEKALSYVTGRPLQSKARKTRREMPRFHWAEVEQSQAMDMIGAVTAELGRRRLIEGRFAAAEQVFKLGIKVEPVNEALYRGLIRVAHTRGDAAETQRVIDRLIVAIEKLGIDPELQPETEALLEEIKDPDRSHQQHLKAL